MAYRRTLTFADGVANTTSGVIPMPLITANGNFPDANGAEFQGGAALFCVSGTLGGGTYQLQSKLPDGTWQNIQGAVTTSAAMVPFSAPDGRVRLVVTGATAPSASSWGFYFPGGTIAASGGGSSSSGAATGLNGATQIEGFATTVTTTFARPANTTAYAINQAIADSTTAPTAGGFTLTNCSRAAGRSGVITDVVVSSSADPATTLAGEVWIYDQAVTTAQNDGAAFAPVVADRLNLVAVIPFTLSSVAGGTGASGSVANVSGLNLGFTTVGTPNLRYIVKAKNAYTPASGEVFGVRLKIIETN